MKKFITRFFLFLLPFIAIAALEVFVLPIDVSTFRVWEALKVGTLKWALPGYFYPGMTATKEEEGDIALRTPYAEKKRVEWKTDRYGYRTSSEDSTQYRVVIIGDSYTAGTSLTQEETLTAQLKHVSGISVYPFAPSNINDYLKEKRFTEKPPDVVIFEDAEWDIPTLRAPKQRLSAPSKQERLINDIEWALKSNRAMQYIALPIDRVLKGNLFYYARASLRRAFYRADKNSSVQKRWTDAVDGSTLFLLGAKANNPIPDEQFERIVKTIIGYRDLFEGRGIRFIFLPVPNKENIYYDLLPGSKKPVFLKRLIRRLQESGVEVLDTQRAFEDARATALYHKDDTHWNAKGVRITAELLTESLRQHRR